MPSKFRDDRFLNKGTLLLFLRRVVTLFDCNHCFKTSTIHVLHDQVNKPLIVINSIVLYLHPIDYQVNATYKCWAIALDQRDHVKFIVELMPLIFVEQVDDL